MPYPQPPPMPMMGTVIPLVPPQISPHQQRHHQQHHHHHHLQHPHLLNQPTTYQLWVPQERVGAVIGGQGTVIRSLQERSGATIQVHNDTVRGDRKLFTIFGTLAQYDIAKQLISDIVEKPRQSHGSSHAGPHSTSDRSPYSQSGDHGPRSGDVWKTVYVPTSCVGLVIGRNGETIRNLQDRSGADIKVTPDEEAQPGADTRSILLSGTDEAISTAHQLVSEIVMDAKSRRPPHSGPQVGFALNGQSLVFEVLSIPNEKVGLIIGKKGATIRDLQMRSGAKIQVTKDESSVQSDGTRPVTLTGMRANVDEAKAMIASKINMPMSQSSTANPVYNNSPPQPGPSSTSPGGPSQPGPGYMVPNLYEPAFQNGQQPFQQGYDANDANAQSRAMAYFQYVGYNNYMAQQRQFQSHMPMHFPIPQQQQLEQQAPSANSSQDQQEASGQPSQYSPTPLQQGQQLESIQGSPGIAQRDASGNIVMYPAQQYQQLSPHMAGHQMYSTGPPNRMFSRREQVQAAQVRAQMVMHAQAHAHAQAQAQAHAQAQAEAQGESEARLQTHEPLVPTPEDDG
ncbi:KH domain-containing protein [Chondrus crispus]|uniref:KH domain-containing protein n=1 Tax=Chondrus crispus TaxID=2769 RepID=R7Q9V2_CHOCR|nr:KH domain-containing protein [Chondrus crispus]CDF34538.1 KH domain-containing protein [Chondrus crispus]|eukprot:XP_005714357.1 KH domain-containing protein [Chondrus crispus]